MTTRRLVPAVLCVGMAVAGLAAPYARSLSQGPSQTNMVHQLVAGVKFSTLPDFSIERVNPPDRNDSYVVLTFDSRGRLVVSKEQDNPRLLLDNDNDGIYESEKVISDKVRNCQGLWFDGPTLYAACSEAPPTGQAPAPAGSGGGRAPAPPAGIYKMTDTNGDDAADTFETVAVSQGAIQEHGPHAIRREPDGTFGVIFGNHASVTDEYLDPDSLVRDDRDAQFLPYLPNFGQSVREGIHSAVYRWDPRIKKFTVAFGGNRNAYDYAYNLMGEAFTFDSDMEWDINLPWYREVRTVHGILGGNYGYRNGSGKYMPFYIDSLPPVRDVGRGSPVGVEFYTSYVYPREFFDSFFEADWSRGRLLYTALTPNGATYSARRDAAEFVHGEPFNITDVEVGPDGMMYFTTGGRNTAGGVWRLRYTGRAQERPDMSGILAVVRQPQPLSSWGWAAIEQVKESKGTAFGTELALLARNPSAAPMDRVRAIYEMQRHGAPPAAALLSTLAADRHADVRAAAVYVAGAQGDAARAIPTAALKDSSPMVRRRAAEALVRMGQSPGKPSLAPVSSTYALLHDTDRFVRWAGRILLERTPRSEWKDRVLAEKDVIAAAEGTIAYVKTAGSETLQPIVDKLFAMMQLPHLASAAVPADRKSGDVVEQKLALYRAFQFAVSQMKDGLPPDARKALHTAIAGQFPSQDPRLNYLLAPMLGYAGQPEAVAEIVAVMPKGNEQQPLQLHYLYALRMIKDGWTAEQKTAIAELLGRASKWRGGAQFVNFIGQFYESVAGLFATDEEKALLYAKAPDLAPLTPAELAEVQARQAAARAAGRGGRGGQPPTALAARRQGRVLSRQEMFEEAIFQPQQQLDPVAGQRVFETNCASCHRFGPIGADHGVAALNLTSSGLRGSKYALLEAIMFPDRNVAPEHELTVIETTDGRTLHAIVLRESGQSVSLLTREGATADVPTAQIKSRQKQKASLMTEAMADSMNQAELRNLLSFLAATPPGGTGSGR